jgi:hypothetical protein
MANQDDTTKARSASRAEWIARMSHLGTTNRDVYRLLRAVMWGFVVENSSRSDFPSVFS